MNDHPLEFLWMYYSWAEDFNEKHEFAKNYTILQGSFTNFEMAKRMTQPVTAEMSEEQLDKVMQDITDGKYDTKKRHRHRRQRRIKK